MRVLFIYPDICSVKGSFYHGIGYISAVLKKHGHETNLIHITEIPKKENITKKIKDFNPAIIGFTSTTNQFQFVDQVAEWVKQDFNIPIICGGIHTTMDPDSVISNKNIDMICIGEGEYAMLELMNAIEENKSYDKIQNLWIKQGSKIKKNTIRPLIKNLESLPHADRDVFNFSSLLEESKRADVIIGRGCPFACSYCLNHKIKEIYKGKGEFVRIRPVNDIISEIRDLVKKYEIDIINFVDDTCTLDSGWVKQFCEKYSKEFSIPFEMNMRVETVNKEMLQLLKNAGCREARFGIESGSEWLRKNILKRYMSNEKIIQAFQDARDAGMKTYSYNMVGMPFETPEMCQETVEINRKIKPDYIQVSVFYPYPGTELYNICRENNFLTKENDKITGYFETESVLNLPTLSKKQIKNFWTEIDCIVFENTLEKDYRKLKPLYRISSKILGKRKSKALFTWIKKRVA